MDFPKSAFIDFSRQHKLPEKLKLPAQEVEEVFVGMIEEELGFGHSPEETAWRALFTLDGMAESEHIPSRTSFTAVYTLENELAALLRQLSKDKKI